MTIECTVTDITADQGSIVVLAAITNDDESRHILIAADHRPTQDIAEALAAGEDVKVEVEEWQIIG